MGSTVYDSGEPICEGAHVFAHSRKDGRPGVVYLIINNSLTETTAVELPAAAQRYTLALGADGALPPLEPVPQPAGMVELAPATCTFLVL